MIWLLYLARRGQIEAALGYYAGHLAGEDIAELAAQMDGWNFRRLARFAEDVVRTYVSRLDLTQLEAGEPPLPRNEDDLAVLGKQRQAGTYPEYGRKQVSAL